MAELWSRPLHLYAEFDSLEPRQDAIRVLEIPRAAFEQPKLLGILERHEKVHLHQESPALTSGRVDVVSGKKVVRRLLELKYVVQPAALRGSDGRRKVE